MIDLHCHSQCSDGLLSPTALLHQAISSGVERLALTDHDTMVGIPELLHAAAPFDIQIIPGIELSVRWKKYDIHVIGLHVSADDPGMVDLIHQQNECRLARGVAIGNALTHLGLVHAYDKACALAGHTRVGRAHFAQVLLQEGWVQEPKAAFARYLGQGRLAYVPSDWINLKAAVHAIISAGGQAVLAHPLKYKLTMTKLHALIQDFMVAGGCALEVVSGDMVDKDIQTMANLCLKFNLLASSGSDYHGENRSRIGLGRQKPLPSVCTPIWADWL